MSDEYYDKNASNFETDTFNVNMEFLYEEFLALIPPGGLILDAGCGPGRDTVAFMKRGFRVEAFDASSKMVELASKNSGLNVLRIRFQDVDFVAKFDGIWACASVLHVPKSEELSVFKSLARALKPRGTLYVSFKSGSGERVDNMGRRFNDHTAESLSALCSKQAELSLIKAWETRDSRPKRGDERWINALLVRK